LIEVTYHVHGEVFERLLEEARERSAVHLAVLTGEAGGDDRGRFAELIGVAKQTYTARLETTYRPMRSALDGVREQMGGSDGEVDRRIAGIAAVYEGSEGKLSEDVARLHLSLCNAPAQVALVGDPETRLFGLYARNREGGFESIAFDIGERDERGNGNDEN